LIEKLDLVILPLVGVEGQDNHFDIVIGGLERRVVEILQPLPAVYVAFKAAEPRAEADYSKPVWRLQPGGSLSASV
jgi:hypothetical protein